MGKQKRVTATVKMTYTQDMDLIVWWNNIPRGQRNAVMKQAMRAFIGQPTAVIQQPQSLPTSSDEPMMPQLQADIAWMRDALNALPDYVEQVIAHVIQHAPVSQQTPNTAPPSDGDHLDDTAAQRRAQRMKKRRW